MVTVSVVCDEMGGMYEEALDISWQTRVFGSESIKEAVIDPRVGWLGVAIAMETERDGAGGAETDGLPETVG